MQYFLFLLLTFGFVYSIINSAFEDAHVGVWLSLVECLVRDQEAGGSNPLTPTTKKSIHVSREYSFLYLNMRGAVLFVQELDNEFFEVYKRLDRLCSEIYDCRNGVSRYIEDMESLSYQGRLSVPAWDESYKTLKHLRWVRNQIAHDSGQIQICEERDVRDASDFYNDIMSGHDPITQLRKFCENRAAAKKASRPASSVSAQAASGSSDNAPSTRRRIGCFAATLLLIAGTVAIIACLFTNLL